MGRVGGWQNLFVSTGHFRNGIQVAPAAAEALADLMMGRASTIDLAPFSTARG
jgi:glycine oxidase